MLDKKKVSLMKCKFCSGDIVKNAIKCKYCGEFKNRFRRWSHEFFIPILIGIIIGYSLFNFGQTIEEYREKNKLIVLFKKEFSQNYAILNNIEMLLNKDLGDLKNNKITITPLGRFYFDAWSLAQSGKSDFLLKISTGDYFKLNNCYFILKIIDTKIADRELYRIYGEGRDNFISRMEALDKNILDNIVKVRSVLKEAQDYLYKIHNWRVKGNTFHTEDGLVVEQGLQNIFE